MKALLFLCLSLMLGGSAMARGAALAPCAPADATVSSGSWRGQSTALPSTKHAQPVVVAVWDEGVDVGLFRGRLYVNPRERANGRDDDGNGFVDDINGIGFDEHQNAVVPVQKNFDDYYPGREDELRAMSNGHADALAQRDTPESRSVRAQMASLKPDDLAKFIEAGEFYDNYYSHGTHVADLAVDGNPAARLLVVRYDSPAWRSVPPPFTPEVAEHFALNVQRTIDYLRKARVRVVNFSWGDSVEMIATTLAANGTGNTAAERQSIAQRSFDIEAKALTVAIASAPEILFIAGAGNAASDLAISRFVPADIDRPNLLAVGAVDSNGAATDFTSYGDRVRIYANGVDIDARVPGGTHQRKTGTSMATPQVTNVAAKLIALNPLLSPAQTVDIILNSAVLSSDRKRRLIDSGAALACVQKEPAARR